MTQPLTALSDPDNVMLEVVDSAPPAPARGMTPEEAYAFLTTGVTALTAAAGDEMSDVDPDVDAVSDLDDDSDADVAQAQAHTGAMVALVPSDADVARLALPGGEAAAELHLTLWFLGDAAGYDDALRQTIVMAVQEVCLDQHPLVGTGFGVAVWNPQGTDPCVVLNVGGEGLEQARAELGEALEDVWAACLPAQHEPWSPHVCLAYAPDPAGFVAPALAITGPVTFDRVRVAFGESVTDVPLGYSSPNPVVLATGVTAEAVTMPYEVREGGGCPASRPYGVYKKDTGERFGCHPSRAQAQSQIAAIHANEGSAAVDVALATDAPTVTGDVGAIGNTNLPGTVPAVPPATAYDIGDDGSWWGVLVVEGVTTGDGREFAPGALTWAEPWLPLRWAPQDYGAHDGAVDVGRIDRVWRDTANPDVIYGAGVFNLGDPDGARAYANVQGQFLRGISVDVDSVKDADVELVFPQGDESPDGAPAAEDDAVALLFGPPPEKTVFHAGRMRGATLVSLPAFVEAAIQLGTPPADMAPMPPAAPRPGATPVPTRSPAASGTKSPAPTSTRAEAAVQGTWDEVAQLRRLGSHLAVPVARDVFAFVDVTQARAGAVHVTACRLPHHEVGADGRVGAASLVACVRGIGQLLADARLPLDVQQRRAAYEHLAGHVRTAGLQPQPFSADALAPEVRATLVAAGGFGEALPPLGWFTDPHLPGPTALTVTAAGQVFGHAAKWDTCHVGIPDVCITPPHEDSYDYFQLGEVLCAGGERAAVGQITLGTGHAPPTGITFQQAIEHYDNTGTAVADVAVGSDDHGIWVAGRVRPGTPSGRVAELRAAKLSGDWRRVAGRLRMVALLAVNVPGFPVPRVTTRVDHGVQTALVAAGVLLDAPTADRYADLAAVETIKAGLRRRAHRTAEERRAELRARVHGR